MAFFVYITTNQSRSVLYTGVTNNLSRRMSEHREAIQTKATFTGRYKAYNLIYFEEFSNPKDAIAREKEIKGWSRAKKEKLVATQNPNWEFISV